VKKKPIKPDRVSRMLDGLASPCADCGADTTPGEGNEFYMISDELWQAVGVGEGFLCIGCLENRLGRQLIAADFIDVPGNIPEPQKSPRLIARLLAMMTDEELVEAQQKAHPAVRKRWNLLMDAVEAVINARGEKKERLRDMEDAYVVYRVCCRARARTG
jgi:hypothetical protein